jgi:hypothetical protein
VCAANIPDRSLSSANGATTSGSRAATTGVHGASAGAKPQEFSVDSCVFLDMRRTLVFLLLLALAGCFRTEPTMSFVNSNIPHRPMIERRPDQVQLYASGPPKRSYVEVGMLQGQGGEYDSPSQVLELMRKEAGRLGCEALIVIGADDSVEGHSNKYFGSTTTYKGFHAVCIVFDVDSSVATSSKASAP